MLFVKKEMHSVYNESKNEIFCVAPYIKRNIGCFMWIFVLSNSILYKPYDMWHAEVQEGYKNIIFVTGLAEEIYSVR
jgi:hypothetical protein